jgi:NAD(P)-dependent dehydrogenase (short-subunit alcohol dehydrogenase family)
MNHSSFFRGKSVLITGASSGIGRTLALQLGAAGAHVTLTARRAELLAALADEMVTIGAARLWYCATTAVPVHCRHLQLSQKAFTRATGCTGGAQALKGDSMRILRSLKTIDEPSGVSTAAATPRLSSAYRAQNPDPASHATPGSHGARLYRIETATVDGNDTVLRSPPGTQLEE